MFLQWTESKWQMYLIWPLNNILFNSVYMFVYLYMCLVGISYTRQLNVKQYKKATKFESKVNRRIAAQLPSFDDIQSNTTYMERLSDLVSFSNLTRQHQVFEENRHKILKLMASFKLTFNFVFCQT